MTVGLDFIQIAFAYIFSIKVLPSIIHVLAKVGQQSMPK